MSTETTVDHTAGAGEGEATTSAGPARGRVDTIVAYHMAQHERMLHRAEVDLLTERIAVVSSEAANAFLGGVMDEAEGLKELRANLLAELGAAKRAARSARGVEEEISRELEALDD